MILLLSSTVSLLGLSDFSYFYNATATAYLKNGVVIKGYFFLDCQVIDTYNDEINQITQPNYSVTFQPGENIMQFFMPAYTRDKLDLFYATETVKTEYGTFVITESEALLKVADLDSLIFIDNELGWSMFSINEINRKQADLLHKQVYCTMGAEGESVDFLLVNTNPDIFWQELLIYASQYNVNPTSGYRLCWENSNWEKQDSLRHYISELINSKKESIFPELAYWAKTALDSLNTIPPYLDKMDVFTPMHKQYLAETLISYIHNCSELYQKLTHLNQKSKKELLNEIEVNSQFTDDYINIIFPVLPAVYNSKDWNSYLIEKGIVVLAWHWD